MKSKGLKYCFAVAVIIGAFISLKSGFAEETPGDCISSRCNSVNKCPTHYNLIEDIIGGGVNCCGLLVYNSTGYKCKPLEVPN